MLLWRIVLIKIAKESDPQKLAELRVKINDDAYLSLAINRIAHNITKELVSMKEAKSEQK